MVSPLDKHSRMECRRHGLRPPAFICCHLQHGVGIGFNQPDEEPDPEHPFKNAWCDECHRVLLEEGEWNERSESQAKIMAICEACFREVRERNEGPAGHG